MNPLQCFRGHHHHQHKHQHYQHQSSHLSPSLVHHQTVASLSITTNSITNTTDYYQQHSLYNLLTNDDSSRLSSTDMDENGSNNRWQQQQQQSQSLAEAHLSPSDSQYSLIAASSVSGAQLDGSGVGDNGSSSGACIWNDDIEEDLDFQHVSFGAEIQAFEVSKKDDLVKPPKKKREKKKRTSKSSYKHVPHREKPVHLVARRNARERKRVQAVNSAFVRLRKVVPVENRGKRLSKVKTLHRAIQYIDELTRILEEENSGGGALGDNDCYKTNSKTSVTSDIKSRKQKLISAVDSCSSEQPQSSSLRVIDQNDAVGHFLEGPIFTEYHHHSHHSHHPEHTPTALMTCTSGALLTRRQPQPHHHQHQLQQQHQNSLSTFAFSSSASLASSSSSSLSL